MPSPACVFVTLSEKTKQEVPDPDGRVHRRDVLRNVPGEKRCQCHRRQPSTSKLEQSVPHREMNRISNVPHINFTDEQLMELLGQ